MRDGKDNNIVMLTFLSTLQLSKSISKSLCLTLENSFMVIIIISVFSSIYTRLKNNIIFSIKLLICKINNTAS